MDQLTDLNIAKLPRGLVKRKNTYWISISRHGRRVRISTKCSTLPAALRFYEDYVLRLEQRAVASVDAKIKAQGTKDIINAWNKQIDLDAVDKASWIKMMWKRARSSAKQRSLQFDLSHDDVRSLLVATNGVCEITGLPFSWEKDGGRFAPFKPSIDRRDCAAGYEIGNCRVVCACVNLAMNVWGEAVFERMAIAYLLKKVSATARH